MINCKLFAFDWGYYSITLNEEKIFIKLFNSIRIKDQRSLSQWGLSHRSCPAPVWTLDSNMMDSGHFYRTLKMWRLDPKMFSHLLSPEVPLCRQPSGEVVCPVANLWNGGSERLRFKKSKNLSFPKEVSLILEVDRTRFAHAAGLF